MPKTNRHPAASRLRCSRLTAEAIGFSIVWWLATLAIIHYLLHKAGDWNLLVPFFMIGPVFWFILRGLPQARKQREETGKG